MASKKQKAEQSMISAIQDMGDLEDELESEADDSSDNGAEENDKEEISENDDDQKITSVPKTVPQKPKRTKEEWTQLRKQGKDYRVPTNEEVMELTQTELLYKSNIFKLQVFHISLSNQKDTRINIINICRLCKSYSFRKDSTLSKRYA